jgi:transposase-like protein
VLLKAIKDAWPEVPRQRCVVHHIRNVVARVPREKREEVRKSVRHIFYATYMDDPGIKPNNFYFATLRSFPLLAKHYKDTLRNDSPSIASPSVTGNTSVTAM